MRFIILALVLFIAFFLYGLISNEPDSDQALPWMTDYARALETAKAEEKPVLLYFTGSNWCGYCVSLEKRIFSKQAFFDFANDEVILVYLDFPRGVEQDPALENQNYALLDRYQPSIPSLYFIDAQEQILGDTGYISYYVNQGAEAYVNHLRAVLAEGLAQKQKQLMLTPAEIE